jgi:hypothetical protein
MSKPIETRYKGYRFRSRLEARWAVFFDELDINYHYELEGFELNEEWYLPDFYLPDEEPSSWIEVKPEVPSSQTEWKELLKLLIELAKYKRENVIAILGEPYPGEYTLYWVGYKRDEEGLALPRIDAFPDQSVVFAESDCGALHLAHIDPENMSLVATIRLRQSVRPCDPSNCRMHIYEENSDDVVEDCPDLWSAFRRARGARFEHGEKP